MQSARHFLFDSFQGEIVCGVFDRTLVIYVFKDKRTVTYEWLRDIACVAVHPTESCIATGDCIGQVALWYAVWGGAFRTYIMVGITLIRKVSFAQSQKLKSNTGTLTEFLA